MMLYIQLLTLIVTSELCLASCSRKIGRPAGVKREREDYSLGALTDRPNSFKAGSLEALRSARNTRYNNKVIVDQNDSTASTLNSQEVDQASRQGAVRTTDPLSAGSAIEIRIFHFDPAVRGFVDLSSTPASASSFDQAALVPTVFYSQNVACGQPDGSPSSHSSRSRSPDRASGSRERQGTVALNQKKRTVVFLDSKGFPEDETPYSSFSSSCAGSPVPYLYGE